MNKRGKNIFFKKKVTVHAVNSNRKKIKKIFGTVHDENKKNFFF